VGSLNRRQFVAGSAAGLSALAAGTALSAEKDTATDYAFEPEHVRRLAQELAKKPYTPPDRSLPPPLAEMKYDAYRAIRFLPDQALWRQEKLPFQLQFFHRGWLYKEKTEIFIVSDGRARRLAYSPEMFSFGLTSPVHDPELGFAGFRIHSRINRPDYFDEVGVFQGASYFRAVAKEQVYGLSARGIALRTGDPHGEEFPIFTTFWIERPAPAAASLVVHALLNGPSVTGAFHFVITPGTETVYDTSAVVYPRTDLAEAGFGTGTSMFFFGANDRRGVDDFRPEVHDSDGLAIHSGNGEELWRPLKNPKNLQFSIFDEQDLRGFGLLQRVRRFTAYEDLESHYEKRPSLWVEPIGQWGPGSVQLVELPANEEIHDNIVAFWRPRDVLKAQREYRLTYRLHWTNGIAGRPELARFTNTRVAAARDGNRLFVLDVTAASVPLPDVKEVRADLTVDKGKLHRIVLQPNPESKGVRLSFEFEPEKDASRAELRCVLRHGDKALTETWVYQWAPSMGADRLPSRG
jgi:glucans biosynthesis protein